MLCSADEAQLMRLLMQLIQARKVIEIGKINISGEVEVTTKWLIFLF